MLIVFLIFLLNLKGLRDKVDLGLFDVTGKHRSIHFRMVIITTLFFIMWQLEGIFYRHKKPTIEILFVFMEPVIYLMSNDYRDGCVCGLPFMCLFVLCVIISSFPPLLLFAAINKKSLIAIVWILILGALVEFISGIYIREYISRFTFLIFASILCVVFTMHAEWVNSLRWIYIFFVFKVYFNGDII
jgi:hypothetical protein